VTFLFSTFADVITINIGLAKPFLIIKIYFKMELQKRVEVLENTLQAVGLATKEVLTFEEAAKFSGLSKSYLYKLTAGRKVPHYKPSGKLCYFNRAELQGWLLQHRVKTVNELEREAATYVVTGKKGGSYV
jgi:excisionase family DNA binding protein